MPRDLFAAATEDTLQGMPKLSESPEEIERPDAMDAEDEDNMIQELASKTARDELHPYTQSLSPTDVDSCTKLEEATFPPNERGTRDKFEYRLKHCGELCLGIFTSHEGDDSIPTASASQPVHSGTPHRKAVLLGHIIATKTTNPTVTDEDMAVPDAANPSPGKLGHKEEGRTVCIHSLAVLPQYQGKGLGKTLMEAYLQRIESHDVADRIALIAHDNLIPFYERFGFVNRGASQCKFGGGGWFDMVKELGSEGGGS